MPLTIPSPDAPRPAGYLRLQQRHGLNCLPNHVESYVSHGTRQTLDTPGRRKETYPRTYWPGDDDFAHLEFALKREGLHLQLLRALLPRIPAGEMTAYVQSKPTIAISSPLVRRIWLISCRRFWRRRGGSEIPTSTPWLRRRSLRTRLFSYTRFLTVTDACIDS